MGVLDTTGDSTENNDRSDGPSISYLYLYEEGREEIEDWDSDAQTAMAEAYNACSDGGVVRTTFKSSGGYLNIHHAAAVLMNSIASIFRDEDFSPVLDFLMGTDDEEAAQLYADELAAWLEENPEVRQALLDNFEPAAAPADD